VQVGRSEMVVGWYHSHPGFGCWLSGVDISTQNSFEQLHPRAVAVVVDPVQSVKGKVVIDAFRLINAQTVMMGQDPRQTTSVLGHLNRPSIQALIHGLNRHYYSLLINYRKNELEERMLLNLSKQGWMHGLTLQKFEQHKKGTAETLEDLKGYSEKYAKEVAEEAEMTGEERIVAKVGKLDAKKNIDSTVQQLMAKNIVQCMGTVLDSVVF
jgi:26S proteasome regulatory subunit N11